jgi:hypothetical protein
VKEYVTQSHILYDSIYMKYSKDKFKEAESD